MFNRTNKANKKDQKNKGFSLVELIVVIAIMAVLVAVLAPQFTKYIDQSRKSNDAATVSGVVTAAQVGIADTTNYSINPGTYKITFSKSSDLAIVSVATDNTESALTGTNNLNKAITDACGKLEDIRMTANGWEGDVIVKIKYDSNGTVSVSYETPAFKNYIEGTTPTE